jgi:hypothetical protein
VEEAASYADTQYVMADALKWALDRDGVPFRVPQEAIDSDYKLFMAHMRDFGSMAKRRFTQIRASRLNSDRISKVISPDNPDLARLIDLAEGIRVTTPAMFTPNGQGVRPKLRKNYLLAHSVVNKLFHDLHEEGLAFYLPMNVALQVPGCHFIASDLVIDGKKLKGRPTIDPQRQSDAALPEHAMNAPDVREAVTEIYGEINHPTLDIIVRMVMAFYEQEKEKDPTFTWEDLVLWKMDLRGAFTLLSVRPEDAKLFGIELTNDGDAAKTFAVFFLCGLFGWTGTPAAFQVITRAIVFQLGRTTLGKVLMYVDDLIGICRRSDLSAELARTRELCTKLLGDNAVADDKTESGRRLDVIGYCFDLDQRRVTVARKNFLKTLYGFFSTDLQASHPLRHLERLASWGSRYATICRALKPFNRAIYSLYCRGKKPRNQLSRHVKLDLTSDARRAIRMWRAMLVALDLDEGRFARSFESFREHPNTSDIGEFDCSLEGVGVLIYDEAQPSAAGGYRGAMVGGGACSLLPLGFADDSSYQNTAEFIGAIFVIITMTRLGFQNIKVKLRGDSISALTWAVEEKFRSDLVHNAAVVFILLLISTGAEIVGYEHLAGEANWRCDALSRPSLMKSHGELGIGGIPFLDFREDPVAQEIIRLCDPALPVDSDDDFQLFWQRARTAIAQL